MYTFRVQLEWDETKRAANLAKHEIDFLKEAELMEDGLPLGPVGGRIVGAVFVGLLKADESSYLAAQPNWTPVLPSATPGDFRITDLLTFAGVVPPLN